jgi:DNA-binding response OmpR family regulator
MKESPMKTVLVIDDSDVVLELVKKSLENAGYHVLTRNEASGSVAAILRDRPDVVLLDVNMPNLSGDTIAKILGCVSQNMETLVLLHSGLSIDNLRLKAIATGAHGYIQKTDSATELVRRIEYWINRSRYATSSNRLGAAPAAEGVTGGDATSSGRFAVVPRVGPSTVAAGAANSANVEPSASSGSNRTASSSTRLRAAAVAATDPRGAACSSGVAKVLFVDNDWKTLSSYRTMVAGYLDAEFVSSSDDAFNRLLADEPPHVVVCDLPGLSGADIYRRAVLLDRRWADRFVFVTGAASTPAVAEFLNALDVRVFHKPVATERLLDTIKQMTEVERR